jgi:hypothetical protein
MGDLAPMAGVRGAGRPSRDVVELLRIRALGRHLPLLSDMVCSETIAVIQVCSSCGADGRYQVSAPGRSPRRPCRHHENDAGMSVSAALKVETRCRSYPVYERYP